MSRTQFSIIGAGWRTEFFLRIAQALPEQFEVQGVLVRDPAKATAFSARWGVPTYGTVDGLLQAAKGSFVVVSVPAKVNPLILRELAERRVAALSETPPAVDVAAMAALHDLTRKGARIQVAEQYAFQPLHAARIALAHSGKLGRITQAQVSIAHGYHGISLMRKLLGVRFEDATITARRFEMPVVDGPDRGGPPSQEKVVTASQDIAWLDFGDRLGIFDFTGHQYFSLFLSPRMLVRGERGEINNETVRYLKDCRTFVHLPLVRQNAGENGNLEGYYLKGILAGEGWAYENPFAPGRLTDDEIAVATCLKRMEAYTAGGPEFYSLPEACQDRYLDLMIAKAIETGERIATQTQPWAQKASNRLTKGKRAAADQPRVATR